MNWKVALIGFGHVGQGLAKVLLEKEKELHSRHGAAFRVTAICTGQNGNFYSQEGLPLKDLLIKPRESAIWQGYRTEKSVEHLISDRTAQIFCELSPTDLVSAEPALSYSRLVLKNSLHLVVANKGPSVLAGNELTALAAENNCAFHEEAAVMSGSPVFSFIDFALCHCRVLGFRGALNGSSNFILSEMDKGIPFKTAMLCAREKGFMEADPSLDIDGWDSTAKAIILGRRLFDQSRLPAEVRRRGIRDIPEHEIRTAIESDRRVRLISQGRVENGALQLDVSPTALERNDPLCLASGSTSVLTLNTDILGDVTITGPGAGSIETAAGVLSDLLRIHQRFNR